MQVVDFKGVKKTKKTLYNNSKDPYNSLMMIEKGNEMRNMTLASVGDVIRAYDFKPMVGRGDCYMEGKVVSKGLTKAGFDGFTIEMSKVVFSGEERDVIAGDVGYVPFEVMFMEYDGRILNLSK